MCTWNLLNNIYNFLELRQEGVIIEWNLHLTCIIRFTIGHSDFLSSCFNSSLYSHAVNVGVSFVKTAILVGGRRNWNYPSGGVGDTPSDPPLTVLDGLLMQYPSGGFNPYEQDQQRFALLLGYERKGRCIWDPFLNETAITQRTFWLCAFCLDTVWPSLMFEPEWRQFPWRCWRRTRRENSAISVGVHDSYATGTDSRARARNSSGREIAAPLSLLLLTSANGRYVNQRLTWKFSFRIEIS